MREALLILVFLVCPLLLRVRDGWENPFHVLKPSEMAKHQAGVFEPEQLAPLSEDRRRDLECQVAEALRSMIDAHGPVGPDQVGSVARRVVGELEAFSRDR